MGKVKIMSTEPFESYRAAAYGLQPTWKAHVAHADKPVLELGSLTVYGYAKADLPGPQAEKDYRKRLIINLSGHSALPSANEIASPVKQAPAGLAWTRSTEYIPKYYWGDELLIDWADRSSIALLPVFWLKLLEGIGALDYRWLDVCCVGGHGRTGTALCCLMAAAAVIGGKKTPEAKLLIAQLRKDYCADAVEGEQQEKYVEYVVLGLSK